MLIKEEVADCIFSRSSYSLKVDYWNTQEMADAIYGLLKYPVLHAMLRRNGHEEVEKLRWSVSAGKVRNLYRNVLSGK